MRRLLATAALLACVALIATGCGGDDSSGSALDSTLSYIPKDSPFVVAVDTDLGGDQYQSLDKIVGKFPFGDQIKALIKAQIEQGGKGISFDEDLKPALGNPFVISATGVGSFLGGSGDSDFLAAIKVDDQDALDNLIEKTKPEKHGEVSGATVYEEDGTFFGVEDGVVVIGGSERVLDAALKRAAGDDHLDPSAFGKGLEGLPSDALARVYVDVQSLLRQSPSTASARRIEWVSALRTLGLTVTARDNAIDVDFNLRTDGSDLAEEDLPLAAGDQSPKVVRLPGELNFAVRDPRQIVHFFETAFQAVDPDSFGDYQTGKVALSKQLNIDIDKDVIAQLKGDLSISIAVDGSFAAREELADAAAFGRIVDKLARKLPDLGIGVTDVTRRGDLYEARFGGDSRIAFGVTNGALVIGSSPARARQIAAKQPESVDGATGSIVLSADAEKLAARLLERLGPDLGIPESVPTGIFARPLRDLTGSVVSSTDGMKGKLTLTLD
jgi:hypothetical protein